MIKIILLTHAHSPRLDVLSALDLLSHDVVSLPFSTPVSALEAEHADVLLIDGKTELVTARNTAQMLKGSGIDTPIMMVLTEGGMAAVSSTWMVDDVVLDSAGPAEIEARLRLASVHAVVEDGEETVIRTGAVMIDEASYTARLDGVPLNLTYKEFELLKFLAQHSGRVFTRAQLLSEVWGYDYYGGTRTVDVHIRRLRSKLGNEHDHMISTVRNVGYSFNAPRPE